MSEKKIVDFFRNSAENRECSKILGEPGTRGPAMPDDLEEYLLDQEIVGTPDRDKGLYSLPAGTLNHRCTEKKIPCIDEDKCHIR